MKLLIISNMSHYHRGDQIVGWGPTVREIDYLAQDFEEVRHIGCLHPEPAPASALPYASRNVRLVPVPPAGGQSFGNKLDILRLTPLYLWTILRELLEADVVHVRCPANIPLLAIVLLALVNRPSIRWVKYAGNWQSYPTEALSYVFQRWWLGHGLHRGVVTVNGQWPGQPEYIHSFVNPCLTDQELLQARELVSEKALSSNMRLIYVGSLTTFKGVDRVLHILARLHQKGLRVSLDLAGDGPERSKFEQLAADLGVAHLARFHGWLPRPDLAPLYAQAHVMVFPSNSEGWPKVLSEGMAYGVVPLASNVSSIPQYLQCFGTGRTFGIQDLDGFVGAIESYLSQAAVWKAESLSAIEAATLFSYTKYMEAVRNMLGSTSSQLYDQVR